MSENFDVFERVVNAAISVINEVPTREYIEEIVYKYKDIHGATDEECELLIRIMETRHNVSMQISSVLEETDHAKWLDSERQNFQSPYWERYEKFLGSISLSNDVVLKLDKDTDRILDLCGNPNSSHPWDRRGMVIGHVQSGKTGNYTGLICKAADAGYKIIIVIAGIHNVLREQTQQRLDEGFLGYDSEKKKKQIGVSNFGIASRPDCFTTKFRDFDRSRVDVQVHLSNLKSPILFVIKKNYRTLDNLLNWLNQEKMSNRGMPISSPMLLIDDEADNASINIKQDKNQISRINKQIRELLSIFSKSCYIGYTATPFANIFISPNSTDEMLGDDLFPRDFIVSLSTPSNYFGANQIFKYEDSNDDENGDSHEDVVRIISESQDLLPIKHKKDFVLEELPIDLKRAVRTFIIARVIRNHYGQTGEHCSMLINASMFTNVHQMIDLRLRGFLQKIKQAISVYGFLPADEALKDKEIYELHSTYIMEYGGIEGITWDVIQRNLYDVIKSIEAKVINSKSPEALNYSSYSSGSSIIAIGGLSLSRGLTLEGLTVSYFSRNSMMYDTLMQMARWFGYRVGYEELCRVWMTEEAKGWYMHIAETIEELRSEIRYMEKLGATPRDFGLKVRTHTGSLMITARQKAGTGQIFLWSADLDVQTVETWILHKEEKIRQSNYFATKTFAEEILKINEGRQITIKGKERGGIFFSEIPVEYIRRYLVNYKNNPICTLTEIKPILEYIDKRATSELSSWDVYFAGLKSQDDKSLVDYGMGFKIICQRRTPKGDTESPTDLFVGYNWRVSSRGIEKVGLTDDEIEDAEEKHLMIEGTVKNFPDKIYRERRLRPLLVVHLLAIGGNEADLSEAKPHAAWGISFPRSNILSTPIEYRVNTTWLQQRLFNDVVDDEEFEDE